MHGSLFTFTYSFYSIYLFCLNQVQKRKPIRFPLNPLKKIIKRGRIIGYSKSRRGTVKRRALGALRSQAVSNPNQGPRGDRASTQGNGSQIDRLSERLSPLGNLL